MRPILMSLQDNSFLYNQGFRVRYNAIVSSRMILFPAWITASLTPLLKFELYGSVSNMLHLRAGQIFHIFICNYIFWSFSSPGNSNP